MWVCQLSRVSSAADAEFSAYQELRSLSVPETPIGMPIRTGSEFWITSLTTQFNERYMSISDQGHRHSYGAHQVMRRIRIRPLPSFPAPRYRRELSDQDDRKENVEPAPSV